jgi:hypothetical protein
MRGLRLIALLAILWIPTAGVAAVDDVTPPETTIDYGPAAGGTTVDPTPTFGFRSSEADSTFVCSVDGGAFAACSSPDTLARLLDGPNSFAVRATDPAGNADPTPETRDFTVDATPPDGTIIRKPPRTVATAHAKTKVSFEFVSSEPRSSFFCSMDGGAAAPCGSPKTYRVRKGEHRFVLVASDPDHNLDPNPPSVLFDVERTRKHH